MKTLKTYLIAALMLVAYCASAQEQPKMEEAIRKGKSDLMEALKQMGDQFNFGISAEQVENASVAKPIAYHTMDFEKLLNYNAGAINTLAMPMEKQIVPLVNGNRVVTTIAVADEKGKAKISGLINHQLDSELNLLPEEAKSNNFGDLLIVYVPNLNTTVYASKGMAYTSYNGSSLKQGQRTEELLKALKRDAQAFQDKFGDKLKEGRLVN